MKKLLLALCWYFVALGASLAQVYNGDLTLTKQSELDTFNYTTVTGYLFINGVQTGGDIINDLSPLLNLTIVGKNFQLIGIYESNLNDLANLSTVGGTLLIGKTSVLNITLPALSSIGSLSLGGVAEVNTTVKSISLPSIKTINGSVSIVSLSALTDINLPNLSMVKGKLTIQGNKVLNKLNFSPTSLGALNISSNPSLSDCGSFGKVLAMSGAIKNEPVIHNNSTNCNCKMEILKSISPPVPNNALAFDGVDDVIELGVPTFYKNSFTIEGWIKPQIGAIFNIYQGENSAVYAEVTDKGKFRFIIRNPPASSGGGEIVSFTSVVDNQCHHFAIVKGDDDFVNLYIDGLKSGNTIQYKDDFSATTFNMHLGQNVSDANRYYTGLMDEIRFWNIARSQKDIFYYQNKTLTGNEPGLVTYYKFDQGTANGNNSPLTTLTDAKGLLNGTFQNFQMNGTTSNFTSGAPVFDSCR